MSQILEKRENNLKAMSRREFLVKASLAFASIITNSCTRSQDDSLNNQTIIADDVYLPLIYNNDRSEDDGLRIESPEFKNISPFGEVGINLAGAEFGTNIPGILGKDYIYPSCDEISKWAEAGASLIRYPFRLERLINLDKDQIHETDMSELETALDCAYSRNCKVLLDMHNYQRVIIDDEEQIIGSSYYPTNRFTYAWALISQRLGNHPGLAGFGLMNEPHDLGNLDYESVIQETINIIREYGSSQAPLVIDGREWSSVQGWARDNNYLAGNLYDPLNKLVFDAHLYFDFNNSGSYEECQTPEECGIKMPRIIAEEFVSWCKDNSVQGFIGEIGVPTNEALWETVIKDILSYLSENRIGAAFWASGSWWPQDYILNLDRSEAFWLREIIKDQWV